MPNPPATSPTKRARAQNIVEMALFWGTKEEQAVTAEEITEIVKKELLVIVLPDYILERNLSRLLSKGTVRLVEGDKYSLKVSRRKEIAELVQENDVKVDYINEQIVTTVAQEYGQELSLKQKEEILGNFYSFLASLFLERANLVAKIVTKKQVDYVPIEFPLRTLAELLAKTHDLRLRKAQRNAIERLSARALFQENKNHIEETSKLKRLLEKSINGTSIFIMLDYLKDEEGITWRI